MNVSIYLSITVHFGDESFQTIDCNATDSRTPNYQDKVQTKTTSKPKARTDIAQLRNAGNHTEIV